MVPVTRKVLADSETPLSAYRKLAANRPGTFLLESAENGVVVAMVVYRCGGANGVDRA